MRSTAQVLAGPSGQTPTHIWRRTQSLLRRLIELLLASLDRTGQSAMPADCGAYAVFLETSPHWITMTDLAGWIVRANQPAANLVGVTRPPALHGSNVLDWVAPEDRSRIEAARRDLLAGKPQTGVECDILRVDKARLRVELLESVSYSLSGKPIGYVVVVREVTDPLRRANTAKLEVLGQMASGIAHDLNQSLALITGYIELARHEIGRNDAGTSSVLLRRHLEVASQAALDGG
jgi:PAS domain S-box-containing protein